MATKTSETKTSETKTSEAKYSFTAEDISALRDHQQNSWAKVAQAFNLGSPGAARRAYSALVRPHTQSVLAGRVSGGGVTAVHLADGNLATVRDAITGRTIVVQRKDRTEDLLVVKVTSVKAGTVNFNDGNKARAVKAEAIIAVK